MTAEKCTATSKQTGKRCGAWPVPGSTVCGWHGGRAPQAQAAAVRRLDEQKARRLADRLGLVGDDDSTADELLMEEVRRCAQLVRFFEQRVVELDSDHVQGTPHGLVWGQTEEQVEDTTAGQFPGTTTKTTQTAQPSIWYALYASERDRLIKATTAAQKAGIDERRVALAESQGALVAQVLRRVLEGVLDALLAAGMEARFRDVWQAAVAEVAPRELRALVTGAAA